MASLVTKIYEVNSRMFFGYEHPIPIMAYAKMDRFSTAAMTWSGAHGSTPMDLWIDEHLLWSNSEPWDKL